MAAKVLICLLRNGVGVGGGVGIDVLFRGGVGGGVGIDVLFRGGVDFDVGVGIEVLRGDVDFDVGVGIEVLRGGVDLDVGVGVDCKGVGKIGILRTGACVGDGGGGCGK